MRKLERLLNLTAALLETGRPLTAEEIHRRVPDYPDAQPSFHRAFERDKDDLREMGVPIELAIGSLRMTLWPTITEAQVDYVVSQVPPAVAQLRTHAISI